MMIVNGARCPNQPSTPTKHRQSQKPTSFGGTSFNGHFDESVGMMATVGSRHGYTLSLLAGKIHGKFDGENTTEQEPAIPNSSGG